jgi:GLPGLI family protein
MLSYTYMKQYLAGLLLFCVFAPAANAQKRISELTLVYEAKVTTGNAEPRMADAFDGATTTIYLKGPMSRSEMVSALFSSTTIHDAKSGSAVVLREVSGQKLLIRMTGDDWKEKNARYAGITFENTGETREIAGYKCQKAVAKMSDGSTFTVFYTPEVVPENKEYDYHFKELNGLPLEYELTQRNLTIRYTVSRINMNPVPASRFDVPTTGYREMTYAESKKTRSDRK